MQDQIIKGSGNSRYLRSVSDILTQYPTYQAFAQALAAGTFPVDLAGLNAAGIAQQGTALSKANLLKDTTAALFSLPATATPDEALASAAAKVSAVEAKAAGASKFVLLKEITTSEAITSGVLELDLSDINFADYQFVHMDCKMMATTQVLYYVNSDADHCGSGWLSIWSSGAHGGSGSLGFFGDDDRNHFTVRITFPSGKEGSRIVSCHRSGNYFGLCTTVTFDTLTSMQFSCSGTIKAGTVIRVWGEG